MSVSRDNHYVPQLYLSRWGVDHKIFVHRLLVPHEKYPEWKLCAIRNTAYIDNLYVRIEDGNEYDDFEFDFNKQYETPVKPVLDRICANQKLTPADWVLLCDYIMAQYVRTPSFYHWVAEWGQETIPHIMESTLKEVVEALKSSSLEQSAGERDTLIPLEVSLTNQDGDEEHSFLNATTVVGKNLWLFVIKHALELDSSLRKTIHSMKWSVVTAPDSVKWPTCDAPVVIAEINQNGELIISNKLGQKRGVIIFPVSQKKVLLAAHKRIFDWNYIATNSFACKIKEAIVNNAFMYVYSSIEDPEVSDIRKRIVDAAVFVRLKKEYASWYDAYKADEAPMLTKERKLKRE